MTLLQWNEIKSIQPSDFETITEYYVELLDIFGIDAWEFPSSQLGECVKQLAFIRTLPYGNCPEMIGEYHVMPLSEVTWGDYLTLEHYSGMGEAGTGLIASMFLRQKSTDKWGVIEWEQGYNEQERCDYLLDYPITDVFAVVKRWVTYKEGITKSYHALFEPNIPEPDELEEMDPEDAKQEAMEKIAKKWGYERITFGLCDNDLSRLDDILNKKLVLVLNFLSMKTELN